MTALKAALESVFPSSCFLTGTKIGEKGRVFSIRKQKQEQIIGLGLESIPSWPAGRRRCDGAFICRTPERKDFMVVLIELKGGHREKALEQIKESRSVMCRGSSEFPALHDEQQLSIFRSAGLTNHGKSLTGIVVGRRSLALKQRERADLRKNYGIKIKFITGGAKSIASAELWKWSDE